MSLERAVIQRLIEERAIDQEYGGPHARSQALRRCLREDLRTLTLDMFLWQRCSSMASAPRGYIHKIGIRATRHESSRRSVKLDVSAIDERVEKQRCKYEETGCHRCKLEEDGGTNHRRNASSVWLVRGHKGATQCQNKMRSLTQHYSSKGC